MRCFFFGFDRLLAHDSEIRWQDGNKSPKIIANPMDKRCSQARANREEQVLKVKLGKAWRVYCLRVPRWLPRFHLARFERMNPRIRPGLDKENDQSTERQRINN